jgi:hypothetical protein
MGDLFSALKAEKKKKKQSNLEFSTEFLTKKEINFESKNDGIHLIVTHNGKVVDFWPSTGKWKDRKKERYSRGVRKLVNYLEAA